MASAHAASQAVFLLPASSAATSFSKKYQQRAWHSAAIEGPSVCKPQNDSRLSLGQDFKQLEQVQRSAFALAPNALRAGRAAAAFEHLAVVVAKRDEPSRLEDAGLVVDSQATATPLSVSPAAVRTLSLVARFYACFAPWKCKAFWQLAGQQLPSLQFSVPVHSPKPSVPSSTPVHSQSPGGFRQASRGSLADRPIGRATTPGSFRTAVGSFGTAGGGDFVTYDDGSQGARESTGDEYQEGFLGAREGESERAMVDAPGNAEDASERKGNWFLRIFGMEEQEEKVWKVPWTGSTILQVMFLWFAAFWLVGSWAVPAAAHALGFNRASFTYRGQAVYSLVTDLAEMLVGLGILMRCLARFRPRVAAGWFWFFPFKWRPGFWMLDTVAGCLLFPIVNMLSQINTELLPLPGAFPGGSPIEQSLSAKDPIANLLYVVVVSVCAPIWEEIIFRGFLLASLTRYMPMWGSVSVSALVFALAHFSLQRLLPLSFLGVVMGVIFVRSRNLLACMVLHSMWNAFVFLELLR